jgi:hypothetical protein
MTGGSGLGTSLQLPVDGLRATEGQRADAERRRAELAEAELARLRALLGERNAG